MTSYYYGPFSDETSYPGIQTDFLSSTCIYKNEELDCGMWADEEQKIVWTIDDEGTLWILDDDGIKDFFSGVLEKLEEKVGVEDYANELKEIEEAEKKALARWSKAQH